jgi:hypothetical protein
MAVNVIVGNQGANVTVNTSSNNPSVVVQNRQANVSTIGLRKVNVRGVGGASVVKQIIMQVTGTKNPRGNNRALQWNDQNTEFGGANNILYTAENNMLLSGSNLFLKDSKFLISGGLVDDETLLVKDADNRDLFRVDTEDKKILFASFAGTEYYIGIGTVDPQEKLHISEGNARFDQDIIVGDDVLPLADEISNVGSESKRFKNIYGNLEFKYIQDGISFIETSIPTGTSSYWIDFGAGVPGLSYRPKVVCNMVAPSYTFGEPTDVYFSSIGSIKTSGYFVVFSDIIRSTGYKLDSYVSAKDF